MPKEESNINRGSEENREAAEIQANRAKWG